MIFFLLIHYTKEKKGFNYLYFRLRFSTQLLHTILYFYSYNPTINVKIRNFRGKQLFMKEHQDQSKTETEGGMFSVICIGVVSGLSRLKLVK